MAYIAVRRGTGGTHRKTDVERIHPCRCDGECVQAYHFFCSCEHGALPLVETRRVPVQRAIERGEIPYP